jgi:hypothetical protein
VATNRAQLGFRFAPPPKRGDITARKHKGNPCSVAAHARVEPTEANMRERIRVYVSGCGPHGATLKEVCERFGKLPNQISGRFSQLKADQQIFDSGRTRDHHTVHVGYAGWVNGSEKEQA